MSGPCDWANTDRGGSVDLPPRPVAGNRWSWVPFARKEKDFESSLTKKASKPKASPAKKAPKSKASPKKQPSKQSLRSRTPANDAVQSSPTKKTSVRHAPSAKDGRARSQRESPFTQVGSRVKKRLSRQLTPVWNIFKPDSKKGSARSAKAHHAHVTDEDGVCAKCNKTTEHGGVLGDKRSLGGHAAFAEAMASVPFPVFEGSVNGETHEAPNEGRDTPPLTRKRSKNVKVKSRLRAMSSSLDPPPRIIFLELTGDRSAQPRRSCSVPNLKPASIGELQKATDTPLHVPQQPLLAPMRMASNSESIKTDLELPPALIDADFGARSDRERVYEDRDEVKKPGHIPEATTITNEVAMSGDVEDSGSERFKKPLLEDTRKPNPSPEAASKPSPDRSKDIRTVTPVNNENVPSSATSPHLYNMRISHHLRSVSSFSATSSAGPTPTHLRTHSHKPSNLSNVSFQPHHRRHPSSSGFGSTHIPGTWGNVVREDGSSIYSETPGSAKSTPAPTPRTSMALGRHSSVYSRMDPLRAPADAVSLADLDPGKQEVADPSVLKQPPRPAVSFLQHGTVKDSKAPSQIINNTPATFNPTKTYLARNKSNTNIRAGPKKVKVRRRLRLFRHSSTENPDERTARDITASYDGSGDQRPFFPRQISRASALSNEPAELWERAVKAYRDEKSALFLSPDSEKISQLRRQRTRSNSVISTLSAGTDHQQPATLRYGFTSVDPLDASATPQRSPTAMSGMINPFELSPFKPRTASVYSHVRDGSNGSLGAWSRYPSHNRESRTGPAGAADSVIVHDFALDHIDVESDPATSVGSPGSPCRRPTKGKTKQKNRLAKATSMTFSKAGKDILRGYARLFRSQSMEFRRHGQGHRSSIATAGILEHPELELLPPTMASYQLDELVRDHGVVNPMVRAGTFLDHERMQTDGPADTRLGRSFRYMGTEGVTPVQPPVITDTSVHAPRNWATHYASCVERPGSSEDSTAFHSPVAPLDMMILASQEAALPSPLKAIGHKGHDQNLSIESVASVRASTIDLVRMMEERERLEKEKVVKKVHEAFGSGTSGGERTRSDSLLA